jgi:cytochrome c biogenesis protein CcdA
VKQGDKAAMINKEYVARWMFIFGIVMVILIIISGIYILFSPSLNYWPKYFRTIFGIVIIVYGFYRSVGIFRKYKNMEDRQ